VVWSGAVGGGDHIYQSGRSMYNTYFIVIKICEIYASELYLNEPT